jgi:two-component system nitrate/nitrite response regulator NarL
MDARLTKGTKEGSQSTEHPSYDKSDAEPAKSPSIRVFLLLESRLLRDILARVIRRHGLEPMACSAPAETAAEDVIKSECDVLLLDFIDPEWLSTIKVCSERNKKPIRIVAIDMGDSRETFLEAVRRGVTGYVLNSASAADIVSAVRLVANGEAICSPQLQALLFREVAHIDWSRQTEKHRKSARLTLRQLKLMKLVANGLTNKEIAKELGLAECTVKNHISRILKQVDAGNRSEAAAVVCGSARAIASTCVRFVSESHAQLGEGPS